MTRRERLMATLNGQPVDRPAVNFYEVGGFEVDPTDPDEANVYNDPSWRPLLQLAEEQTDLIRMRKIDLKPAAHTRRDEFFQHTKFVQDGSRFTRTIVQVAGRTLQSLTRRDPAVDTVWHVEHLLKNLDDLKAFLALPDEVFAGEADLANLLKAEREVGERGLVMVDTEDPICAAAMLFSMEDYLLVAFQEPAWFHRLLEKFARHLHRVTAQVARAFPGHLWRIYGPEFATEPYLPPRFFREYVVRYTGPMVDMVQKHGGYARVHCHGRLAAVLPDLVQMHPAGLDPLEPPPQGDVQLADLRRDYGKDLVLFGNLEARDLEYLPPDQFEKVVAQALREGTQGEGRGFVLMPSASPYGRTITPTTLANYETMVRLAAEFSKRG
jgi:uroporphyrinogen-III decarboxylase